MSVHRPWKKPAAPALPVFGDAYLSDTQHLSLEEHGAYFKLLLIAWRTAGCCLPNDDARIARMLGIGPRKWAKLKPTIMAFWQIEDGVWRQRRLTKERVYVDSKRAANTAASNARWHGEGAENKGNAASGRISKRRSERTSERNAPPPPPLKSSVGKPTAAERGAVDDDFDPVKALFDDGIEVLGKTGVKANRARSLIGAWRKTHGDEAVAIAIAAAESRGISQPLEWIPRHLAARAERQPKPSATPFLDHLTRELEHEENAGAAEQVTQQ